MHELKIKNRFSAEHARDGMKYKRSPGCSRNCLQRSDIILAAPPASHRKYEKSRGVIASLFGSGAMFGASMLTGTMSPALLAARAASLVMPISSAASSGSMTKSERKVLSNTKRCVTKNTEHISMSRKPVLKQSHAFSVKF